MTLLLLFNGILFAYLVISGNLTDGKKKKKSSIKYGLYVFLGVIIISILFYFQGKMEWIKILGFAGAIVSSIAMIIIIFRKKVLKQ